MEDGVDGAGVAMSPLQPDDDAIINHLAHGPLHCFADWPNAEVPNVAIGIYTVWRGDEFVYGGVAGTSRPSSEES
jgi:hypothetical protein